MWVQKVICGLLLVFNNGFLICFGKLKSVYSQVGHDIYLPISYTIGYSTSLTQGSQNSNVPRFSSITLTHFVYSEYDWNQIHKSIDKHWITIGF